MLTPFEEGGGASWTSRDDMVDFIHALADSSDRARIVQLGRTVQERPIYAIAVGAPGAPLRGRPVAFHVAGQHGNEHGSYESAIAQARDLTETTDPATLGALQQFSWLILPSASPDTMGLRKYNWQWVDMNRDHAARSIPETRAIAKALRDYRPCLTLDSHSAIMSYDFVTGVPRASLGNHPAIAEASLGVMSTMGEAMRANGRTIREITGGAGGVRETLRNTAAYAHSCVVLLEGSRNQDPVEAQVVAKIILDAATAHLGTHLDELVQAASASRAALTPPTVARSFGLTSAPTP